ncbi:hypothetical protein BOTBODRAFT_30673 [Botryobasidium botryosum FD-172 SS1]|uniref:Uncharacterized protein n=1 Tax=Botryobasidium botryosum (strain FD-172 SS1) TaxID=930990 RepID=A0A067MMK0_BOTB1|nr:hypothetical protein BOTBODRAFT_30673 [Botryobasidium botryosum FD-172 SS1]
MPLFCLESRDTHAYDQLPAAVTSSGLTPTPKGPHAWNLRIRGLALKILVPVTLLSLICLLVYGPFDSFLSSRAELLDEQRLGADAVAQDDEVIVLPPLYGELKVLESQLPQHNLSLPFPEGKNGRYIRFENQMWGVGLNNQLEEILILSHLAHLSNRAYVFNNYTWDQISKGPYVYENGRPRATVIPLTAFISGPTAGGPWAPGDPAPRAISAEWWETVCPYEKRLVLNSTLENASMGLAPDVDGDILIAHWAEKLRNLDHECVALDGWAPSIVDIAFFVSNRVTSLFPMMSDSPVITRFAWSSIVRSGVIANYPLLLPGPSPQTISELPVLPGLVAIHLRRGDYYNHCKTILAPEGQEYMGWNRIDGLPDRFTPPPGAGGGALTPEAWTVYLSHCWPSDEQIKEKLRVVRAEDSTLTRVFVLTNGKREWVSSLKKKLLEDGWEDVATTLDLNLTWEQSGVNNAIDMEIAARAQTFIGNGFSSLTSNVNILRISRGMALEDIRFW